MENILGIRIKQLREKHSMTQKELAKKLNVSNSTMSQYESGVRVPSDTTKLKIASLFDVSTDYLLGRREAHGDVPKSTGGKWIPVLGKVIAGIPIEAVECVIDYEEISADVAAQGDHFALQIKGDSMEPKMSEGDIVIVRNQNFAESGDICVVLVNGCDATVKKIKKDASGVMLIPLNSNYEPTYYSNQEIETLPVTILGRVVELRAKF